MENFKILFYVFSSLLLIFPLIVSAQKKSVDLIISGGTIVTMDAQKTVIAASVTTTVRIDLDVSELSAGGFGLLLIPAPQT